MSGGEQQMLAIARGLMISPPPAAAGRASLGLAPRYVEIVFETLARLKDEGLSMLVVEQNAQALALSDRAYLLDLGRNRLQGSGQELLQNPETRPPLPRRITSAHPNPDRPEEAGATRGARA